MPEQTVHASPLFPQPAAVSPVWQAPFKQQPVQLVALHEVAASAAFARPPSAFTSASPDTLASLPPSEVSVVGSVDVELDDEQANAPSKDVARTKYRKNMKTSKSRRANAVRPVRRSPSNACAALEVPSKAANWPPPTGGMQLRAHWADKAVQRLAQDKRQVA
jgi:hypothetical protein